MVNYLSRFLPNLSDVMKPLRDLTHKDTAWCWDDLQEKAWSDVKKLIVSAPVLAYYKSTEALEIQCDISQSELGAALMQNGLSIAYASRALTKTESRYAQIEKEMLAIVFSVEKFNDYTFGRKTIVHTDHKPLESIVKKPLHCAPKRLQGMMIRLQKYDLDIRYERGAFPRVRKLSQNLKPSMWRAIYQYLEQGCCRFSVRQRRMSPFKP